MNKQIEIRAIKANHHGGISIFIDKNEKDKFFTVTPLTPSNFKERHLYETDGVPMTIINDTAAQQLIDDLWQCGLRPSEGTGSAGALAAVEKHLADMRKIVGSKLKIEL